MWYKSVYLAGGLKKMVLNLFVHYRPDYYFGIDPLHISVNN